MAKQPRISVLCQVLNVEKYIAETIESVQAQSFKDWELIIMDGVSKDGTIDIIRSYAEKDARISWYSEPDECSWHAFDKMLDLAKGEFMCNICGQDGFFDKDWFAKCIEAFDRDPDISLAWGLAELRTEEGEIVPGKYDAYYRQFIQKEGKVGVLGNILKKGFGVAKDILFGSSDRRRVLLEKIFSPHARLKMNALTKRDFQNGPPQKQDWFLYWLETGLPFLDLSMMMSTKVFLKCIPRYQLGHPVIEYMSDFFYNFNVGGYLAYFIPSQAIFARMHPGNSTERAGKELHERTQRYLDRVVALRNNLLKTGGPVNFFDQNGKLVDTRRIRDHAWEVSSPSQGAAR